MSRRTLTRIQSADLDSSDLVSDRPCRLPHLAGEIGIAGMSLIYLRLNQKIKRQPMKEWEHSSVQRPSSDGRFTRNRAGLILGSENMLALVCQSWEMKYIFPHWEVSSNPVLLISNHFEGIFRIRCVEESC